MTRPMTFAAALALTAAAPLLAQGPATAAPQDAPAVRRSAADLKQAYFALQDEFDEATEAYRAKVQELSKLRQADPNAAIERPTPPSATFFPRFQAIADEGSLDADVWVVQNHSFGALKDEAARADKRTRALRILASGATNEQLTALSRAVSADAMGRGAMTRDEAFAVLDLITGVATDAEVQAGAAYTKAGAQDVRGGSRDERMPAITALKAVEARWPETKAGKRAGGAAFAFENLNVGQTAPEIVGADVDGNAMKLSDFAGKVVVLDFWGFW